MPSIARSHAHGATILPFPAAPRPGSFTAGIRGDIEATFSGEATLNMQPSPSGHGTLYSLCLGTLAAQGGLVLSWAGGSRPAPGPHSISRGLEKTDRGVRGRVFLGPAERPIAELVAEGGSLKLAEVSEGRVRGSFAVAATGRVRDGQVLRVWLTGAFCARIS
jgi:hypothetical protein